MLAIEHGLTTTMIALSLSTREERAGRDPERGAIKPNAPPLPGPLLHCVEEREKATTNFDPKRVKANVIFSLNSQHSTIN